MGVFISYAQADRAAAEQCRSGLISRGLNPWLAPASMQGRLDFPTEIAKAICDAKFFLLVCSAQAAESDWVFRELMHAIANGKPVVPVILGDFPSEGRLRLMVGPLDWIDAKSGVNSEVLDRAVNRLGGRANVGRVITTLNLKGGVGKTTLTANLGVEAYYTLKLPSLFIDLDPQYNLTQYFLGENQIETIREKERTVLNLLDLKNADAADIVRVRDNCFSLLEANGDRAGTIPLDLLAGHDGLFAYTVDERSALEMQRALANFASFVNACRPYYSVIWIDVNPSASFLTRCALSVSDQVMAPVRPERYALNGLVLLERWLARVRNRPFDPDAVSVVINKMAERYAAANSDLDTQTRDKILQSETWGKSLAPRFIPYSVTLAPSAFGVAAIKPVHMAARFGRTPSELLSAMSEVTSFVCDRAGVVRAR